MSASEYTYGQEFQSAGLSAEDQAAIEYANQVKKAGFTPEQVQQSYASYAQLEQGSNMFKGTTDAYTKGLVSKGVVDPVARSKMLKNLRA